MEPLRIRIPPHILEVMQKNGTSNLLTSMSDLDRSKWLAEQANKQPGNLPGFRCPECLNRGYIVVVDENGRRHTPECRCMARRRSEKIAEKSGLLDMLSEKTFKTWVCKEKWQKTAMDLAQEWANRPSGWLFLAGAPGTGKTHLCVAVCGLLMDRGLECRYMLWRDVSVRAKAVVNNEPEYQKIVSPLKRVPVLYIDDLFKSGKGQSPTTGDVNLAFEILNARYNQKNLLTILSSEWTMEQILDIDEAVGSRIYERAKGHYVDLTGRENWRLKKI